MNFFYRIRLYFNGYLGSHSNLKLILLRHTFYFCFQLIFLAFSFIPLIKWFRFWFIISVIGIQFVTLLPFSIAGFMWLFSFSTTTSTTMTLGFNHNPVIREGNNCSQYNAASTQRKSGISDQTINVIFF